MSLYFPLTLFCFCKCSRISLSSYNSCMSSKSYMLACTILLSSSASFLFIFFSLLTFFQSLMSLQIGHSCVLPYCHLSHYFERDFLVMLSFIYAFIICQLYWMPLSFTLSTQDTVPIRKPILCFNSVSNLRYICKRTL